MSTEMLMHGVTVDLDVRQGEWFFVPAPEVDPPVTMVLFDEPLFRGRGKAHILQFAHRRAGDVTEVFAKGAVRHPEHATIVLRVWHRVATNTEQADSSAGRAPL